MSTLYKMLLTVCIWMIASASVQAQIELEGGFEGELPSYWTKGSVPGGATLTWASDESRSLGRSLKISKTATMEAAQWVSENMADYWSPQHLANVDIKIGAYVKTENVNVNPANDDERWWISYTFYDEQDALIGETLLPIDQSVASSGGFVADTNAIGETILPVDSWRTIIKFVGGKDATGTVWADDFLHVGRAGAWAGQNWNQSVGVPSNWIYWLPPIGGNDGRLSNGYENTRVTNEAAHSGMNSLKFDLPFDRSPQDAFVGTKRIPLNKVGDDGLKGGDKLKISVWLKGENLVPDSAAAYPVTWAVGFTYGFFKGNGNNDGFNNVDGYPVDVQFKLPAATAFDWQQYHLDITVPDDAEARTLEVRLHAYSRFTGTIYWDDLTVEKLDVAELTSTVGGFEGDLPSYWTKGSEPGGATLTWATDESRSLGRSLKISKTATTEAAQWVSENMADYWSPQHLANVDIKIGAYVKTENVNVNPANDDERWWISYTFYDEQDALIGETLLPIDQSVASSGGFVADTNAIGETILPVDSWRTIIKFVGGKDATGTVWADDFLHVGRAGAWAGQNWNQSVGVPSGWIYWLPPIGGNDGRLSNGYENTRVTNEAAHSGMYSLKFDLPFDRSPQDAFVGTKRFLLNNGPIASELSQKLGGDGNSLVNVQPGDKLTVSVWLKGENLVPDSAAAYPVTWAVGYTYGFFKGNGNNDGFNNVDGYPVDVQFKLPAATSFDWQQYHLDITVPDDAEARALEVRLHAYSRFTGTIYWDDLTVEKLDVPELTSTVGGFEGDLPSYWTKGSEPGGATLTWATDESRSLGRSLKISKTATMEAAQWVSENMADYWSPQHLANVDIKIGAYVKTENVNVNPANDDERWWISYTFYDEQDALIGETLLPIDQSVASSGGFVADTNAIGETILPVDSWRTIIKFVGGKDATGTVWADDFLHVGRAGAWAGQNWNQSVGVPSGWIYWLPPIGGNDGRLSNGYENTRVTNEAAHSGMYSLKFDLPFDRAPQDAFVGTKRFLLNNGPVASELSQKLGDGNALLENVQAGDKLKISVWLKGENLVPDSAAAYPVTWAVGYTYGFFKGNGNNDGFNNVDGYPVDVQFKLPAATAFDWQQYHLDITVPDDAEARALEVRLHAYSRFTGTIYWDDLTVEKQVTTGIDDISDAIPGDYELVQNYPNPFNPSTTIQYGVPQSGRLSINIYNLLGQKVRNLVDAYSPAGRYETVWDGRDNFGNVMGSGIYFYRLETSQAILVRKMMLIK